MYFEPFERSTAFKTDCEFCKKEMKDILTEETILYSSKFFISNEMKIHTREVFDGYDLFVYMGGFLSSVSLLFTILGKQINRESHLARLIQNMFFYKPSDANK